MVPGRVGGHGPGVGIYSLYATVPWYYRGHHPAPGRYRCCWYSMASGCPICIPPCLGRYPFPGPYPHTPYQPPTTGCKPAIFLQVIIYIVSGGGGLGAVWGLYRGYMVPGGGIPYTVGTSPGIYTPSPPPTIPYTPPPSPPTPLP